MDWPVARVLRSIDEPGGILQCLRTMRLKIYTWTVLLCSATATLNAQTAGGPTKVRTVSLNEAVRIALQQNMKIKVGSTTPQIAKLELERSYSAYDPVLSGRGEQSFNNRPGGFDSSLGIALPGSENWNERFQLGVDGSLPTGTRYSLSSSLNRTSGRFFDRGSSNWINQPFEYSSLAQVNITQPLLKDLWIDSGRYQIRLAKSDFKISKFDLEFSIMEVVHSVSQAYYDLIASRDQIKVRQMALQLKEQAASDTKKKVQAGSAAPLEEKQAESEAAVAKVGLITALNNADLAENVLKGLISDDFDSLENTVIEPSEKLMVVTQVIDRDESKRMAFEMRPDYLAQKERLEKQKIQVVYFKNQLFPSLDLVGSYGRNGIGDTTLNTLDTIGDNRFPRWGGGAVLTVPLSRVKERSNNKIAKIYVEQSLLQMKKQEQEIRREVDDAVKQVRSALATIDASREARVYAEAALDAEQKRLENGKSTNFQVLKLQDTLTQARSAEIDAMSKYNKSLHDLYFKEGTTLQRAKIDLQVK